MPEDRHAASPGAATAAAPRQRRRPAPRVPRWLMVGACAVALLVALGVGQGFWASWEEHRRLAASGVVTDGTIVGYQEVQYRAGRAGGPGTSVAYTPTFRYRTADGGVVEGTVPERLAPDEIRPGRVMRVVYDPANPAAVRLASAIEEGPGFLLWLESGLMLLFIALFGLALISLLFQRNALPVPAPATGAAARSRPGPVAAWARRVLHRVACALGLLVALGFAFSAWVAWDDHRSMVRTGIAADATILRYQEVRRGELRGNELRRSEQVTYRLTLRYRTVAGAVVEGTLSHDLPLDRSEVEPGRVMRVVYDPADPTAIRLPAELAEGPGVAPWAFAGFALLAGIPCAIGLFRRRATG